MTARAARGQSSRGRRGRSVSTRRAKEPGLLEQIGFAPGTGKRIASWTVALVAAGVILSMILIFRLPQLAAAGVGEGLGNAGFTMRRVEIKGAARVPRLAIYNVAFDQPSMALAMIDLEATRARLLQFGWIREARVSRRWPDTLVIDVIEREPIAIWQHEGRFSLIDIDGVVLEPMRVEARPQLLEVIGAGANRNMAELGRLIEAAPRLRPLLRSAARVGDRRWDLYFISGERVMLPEGEELARRALVSFAARDEQLSYLGRNMVWFDMRNFPRTYVRFSNEPGAIVPTMTSPDPGQPPADLADTI